MRTKTFLLGVATLAAGLATSMAQSNVYSVNVAGYVNQVLPADQLVLVANPLDNGTNTLNSVLANIPNKSTAAFWNGAGFDTSTKSAVGWSVNYAIPPGVGFFINSKAAITNTYVGNVAAVVGGSVTNALPAETLVLVSSMIPFHAGLNDASLNLNLPNKSTAAFWNGNGYDTSTKSAVGWSGTFTNTPGQGFFLNSKTAYNWVQTLPAN